MKQLLLSFFLFFALSVFSQNQVPQIQNVSISLNGSIATINYSLSDAENDDCEIYFLISDDNGKNFVSKAGNVSGDIGYPIQAGSGKQIFWDTDTIADLSNYAFKIVADDRQIPSIQTLVNQVDSNLLRKDLEYVSGIRHYQTNPAKLEAVKDSIENRYNAYGLQTYRQDFMRANYLGQNIIGKKAGLAHEDSTYIIDAHFDSEDDAPGADDNGSGVVGVWEALRVLAPYNFKKTIKFIGFDFEESVGGIGTWGSLVYTQSEISAWEKILGVANFEMIGYYNNAPNSQQIPFGFDLLFPNQYNQVVQDSSRGNFIISAGAGPSAPFVNAYDTFAKQYVPELKIVSINLPDKGTISSDFRRSDHAHFWDLYIPALMITDGANFRNVNYHTPSDTIGTLNFTFMSNVVKATVATVASLAGLQHSSFYQASVLANGIEKNNINCEISIAPNPAKVQFQIDAKDCFAGGFSLALFDVYGRKVLQTYSKSERLNVDISAISKGIYFGVIENESGKLVKKIQVLK